MVDGDSLIRDFYSRGANCVHITILTDCGVLLQPIKDMVARRSFDKYCTTTDGYRAKAFKPPRWADSTGDFAGKMYRTHQLRSVDKRSTRSMIIYDKHWRGSNLVKIGASPMDCVCKLCGGEDSQHRIVGECLPDQARSAPEESFQ